MSVMSVGVEGAVGGPTAFAASSKLGNASLSMYGCWVCTASCSMATARIICARCDSHFVPAFSTCLALPGSCVSLYCAWQSREAMSRGRASSFGILEGT